MDSFTLKNTLEEGFNKGYDLSKKITGKDLKTFNTNI